MPLLAGFLQSVFVSLFSFFGTYFAKKVALGAAVAATLLAVTTAFYIGIKALVAGVAMTISNDTLLMMFFAIWPSNAETCLAAMVGSDIAAFLYRHQIMTIRAVASSS